jgi:O-antigen/teichoic acid export membrane protein
LLNACDRQTRNTVNIGIIMVINVILNLILIPRYSVIGAAVASTFSTLLMSVLQIYVARLIIKIDVWYLIKQFSKIIFAGLAMYLVIIWLKSTVFYLFLIPFGAVIFFLVLFIIKGFTLSEFKDLLKNISQKSV